MNDDRTTRELSSRVSRVVTGSARPLRRWRMWLSLICLVVAGVWMAWQGFGRNTMVHNPGPLTSVHAIWTENCATCHDGAETEKGVFSSRGVSDASCLKCHDGAIHHPNQVRMISTDSSSSASCVACHTEHRGTEQLLASADQNCTQCHADLPASSVQKGAVQLAPVVTSFAEKAHPKFGRNLEKDGKMVDPTLIKFNHKYHMKLPEIQNNCTLCHNSLDAPPGAAAPATDKVPPPYKTAKDRDVEMAASSDGRYIAPLSFDRHCIACHELKLKDGTFVPHESMKVVKPVLAVNDLKWLGVATEAQPGRAGRRAVPAKSANQAAVESLRNAIKSNEAATAKLAEIEKSLPAPSTQPTPGEKPDVRLAELHVMFAAGNSCVKCHDIAADDTAPSGIPSTPRRWFANSQFDHAAHRNLSCVSCHVGASESEFTSDLLQPNIESCVTCHKPDVQHAAPANCNTCHQFHGRSRERSRDGKFSIAQAVQEAAATSQPAK